MQCWILHIRRNLHSLLLQEHLLFLVQLGWKQLYFLQLSLHLIQQSLCELIGQQYHRLTQLYLRA